MMDPAGGGGGAPQPGSPDFEQQLNSSLQTHKQIAQKIMAIDPVKGAAFADKYLEEQQKTMQALAVEHARQSAVSQYGKQISDPNGAFMVPMLDGKTMDASHAEFAKSKLLLLAQPGGDPKEQMQAIKDLGEAAAAASKERTQNTMTTARLAYLDNEMAERVAAKKPADVDGLADLKSKLIAGHLTPKEFDAQADDIIHGRKELKDKLAAMEVEKTQQAAEAEKANAWKSSAFGQKWAEQVKSEARMAEDTNKAKLKHDLPPRPDTMGERSTAVKNVQEILQNKFPDGRVEAGGGVFGKKGNAAEYDAEEKRLRQDMGLDAKPERELKKDSPTDIINSSDSKEKKIERAKRLGFKSYAEVEAAAKGKK